LIDLPNKSLRSHGRKDFLFYACTVELTKISFMSKKNKDLPVRSDATPKKGDRQYKEQDEYATPAENEVRNERDIEQMRDSQQGDERMRPETKGHSVAQRGREQHPQ
jgi:hypothetical protein